MRAIIIDGKKVGVITVAMVLMIALFFMGNYLKPRKTFIIQSQHSKKYTTYEAIKGNISYELPSHWKSELKNFSGDEIIYHNDFKSENQVINGFVQVWRIAVDLKEFLTNSKKIAEKQNDIIGYNITPGKVKGRESHIVTYKIRVSDDIYYRAYENFIKYEDGFIRFSFYTKDDDSDKSLNEITEFEYIVNSLNIK
ncbi:hypothetical protein SH2C18_11250 [Clostridium sediminicola]|uniref:hypothetical protein n=1 Tax=Clostridium sediminicola TaxID=3114879 RepID=UPI0031F27B0D